MVKDAKFYVRISNDLNEKVEHIANTMGMSKSSLVAYYVAQGVQQELIKLNAMVTMTQNPEFLGKAMKEAGISEKLFGQVNMDELLQNIL